LIHSHQETEGEGKTKQKRTIFRIIPLTCIITENFQKATTFYEVHEMLRFLCHVELKEEQR
jgi:hypothetical protein